MKEISRKEENDMSEMSEFVRTNFAKGDDERDRGLTTPADVVRFDDIVYGQDPKWQSLDVYRPAGHEGEKLPVIVSVHGGGWVYGDKERYQFYAMNLAERGFAVVNFNYRLAPEVKFPASLEDTNAVFAWVLAHAEEYGFDTKNIFAVGDSAGGHNLMMFMALCTDPAYAKAFSFKAPAGFVPRAIALNCAAVLIRMSDREEDVFFTGLMKDYLPEGGSEREQRLIHTLEYVSEAFPPVFVMTAQEDFLKADAMAVTEKLLEKNVPFVFRFYRDAEEKLGHVFHLNMRSQAATLCNDEECRFFKSLLA